MNNILFNVAAAIIFIIPGLIVISIKERAISCEKKDYKFKLLDFFIYSFINALLWGPLVYQIILNIDWWIKNYMVLWLLIITATILSPIIIALIVICINKYEVLRKICEYFEIKFIEPEPSAWDYKFSNMKTEWVIVTLDNDKIVAGFMGGLSCASSNEKERDLYINEVYTIDENNEWHKVDGTNGIFIKSNQIKYIEFFKK